MSDLKEAAIYGMTGSMGKRITNLLTTHYPDYHIYNGREKPHVPTVFICTPTETHIPIAIDCIVNRNAKHIWVEKPLGLGILQAVRLCELADHYGVSVYCAYPLRFHPGILRVAAQSSPIHTLHVICTSDASKWSNRLTAARGGGAILELSHEIDYACMLGGMPKKMSGFVATHKDQDIDIDHVAHITITHESGMISYLYLDIDYPYDTRRFEVDKGEVIDLLPLPGEMWRSQLDYFMGNVGNIEMVGNVHYATQLLGHMLKFKEIAYREVE